MKTIEVVKDELAQAELLLRGGKADEGNHYLLRALVKVLAEIADTLNPTTEAEPEKVVVAEQPKEPRNTKAFTFGDGKNISPPA